MAMTIYFNASSFKVLLNEEELPIEDTTTVQTMIDQAMGTTLQGEY